MFKLPAVKFDPVKAEELGDRLVAAVFLTGTSWLPTDQIVYPDIDVWVGFHLIVLDGNLTQYAKFLKCRKRRP